MLDELYRRENAVKGNSASGGRPYFTIREPAYIPEISSITLRDFDNPVTLAEEVFGSGNQDMYPYIMDANVIKHPDTWRAGDVLNIPVLVVIPKAKETYLNV